jgi:hypothetical protein
VVAETEGSKFWLAVLNDLRRRGVEDVLIACVDGLKGFPEAIEATFPEAWVQTCIVHLIRSSLRYVNYRDRKKVASALRPIYTAPNADQALAELDPLRRPVGRGLPADRSCLAKRVAARHPVPGAARRAAPRGLHHQHDRGLAPPDPQDHQDPRALPRRTSRHKAHLPRDHQGRRQVAAQPHLDNTTRRAATAPKYSHHNAAVWRNAMPRQRTTVDVRPASAAVAPVTTIDSPRAMMMNPWQRSVKWPPSMS